MNASTFLQDSGMATTYNRLIMKHIAQCLRGDCAIHLIEGDDHPLLKRFDQMCGIDAFQEVDGQLRGVALRVQYSRNYETFSIRFARRNGATTEFYKRIKALQGSSGYLYPYLTMQIYIDEKVGSILGGAICKTEDLYDYVLMNLAWLLEEQTRTCPEGNKFIYVTFQQLRIARRPVKIIRPTRLPALTARTGGKIPGSITAGNYPLSEVR